MEKFILPEKWYVTSNTKEEDNIIVDYFTKTFDITISRFITNHRTWYYSNNPTDTRVRNKYDDGSSKEMEEEGSVKITYDQFEKYVLNKQTTQEVIECDLELETILKRLLNI